MTRLLAFISLIIYSISSYASASYTIVNQTGSDLEFKSSSCMHDKGSKTIKDGGSTTIEDSNAFFGGCTGFTKNVYWNNVDTGELIEFDHSLGKNERWTTYAVPNAICLDKHDETVSGCNFINTARKVKTIIYSSDGKY